MARTVRDPLTYAACRTRWESAPKRQRDANAVKLAANTWLVNQRDEFGEGDFAVRYYGTVILTFRPDGAVIYDCSGHRSVTTKERLNRFGPCQVWQANGAWYIATPGGEAVPYADGHVHPGPLPPVRAEYLTAAVRGLVAAIRATADWSTCPVLADALAEAGAPDPLTDALRSDAPDAALRALSDSVRVAC